MDNPRDDVVSTVNGDQPLVVKLWKRRWFLGPDEAAALRLFEQPQYFDEDLLQRAEIVALQSPRESLAVWLRRGVLVAREG